jgi:hypothetical protein
MAGRDGGIIMLNLTVACSCVKPSGVLAGVITPEKRTSFAGQVLGFQSWSCGKKKKPCMLVLA